MPGPSRWRRVFSPEMRRVMLGLTASHERGDAANKEEEPMLRGKSLGRFLPGAAVFALAASATLPILSGAAGAPNVVLHASDDGTVTHVVVGQIVEVQLQ